MVKMITPGDVPPELCAKPQALIVLTGLDIVYNAVHKLIWDAFNNNRRPDRVPIQFQVLPGDHEYPKPKPKKTSYEWYIPKGILKTNWMHKHLHTIPAIVVVFFELDWDEAQWNEKRMECVTLVEVIRTALEGQQSKVVLVLIQKNTPLPPGEDKVAEERAAQLSTACNMQKLLFVLPHTDHLLGYVIRLENALYEIAKGFYLQESRTIKTHRDYLNKTTHALLFVRHQFKIAFYNELKQDTHTAIKHYRQAYINLQELRITDYNLLEIKVVAGFLNYKICKICFQHSTPLDAISQFRKHVDFYKNKIGAPDLAFEHSAWLSKQFSLFGDLFEEAIKAGLAAIQTQHPGFYYQEAANHAVARKQLCRALCHADAIYPSPDPLENMSRMEYYGQRAWRQGHQSLESPHVQREREGILALQIRERQVDHSWLVIPLLSSAVAQFKKYKCARLRLHLVVLIGEEYYHAKDYDKALALLGRVTWDYRSERWWKLLTHILLISLRCAYLVRNISEYVTICLELIGKHAVLSCEEKYRIATNLIKVMSRESPDPEPGCEHECVEAAKQLWALPQCEALQFTVEMHNLASCIECKARFVKKNFTAESLIKVCIALHSCAPVPIHFTKLSVFFKQQSYNQNCVYTNTDGTCLHSTAVFMHQFTFPVKPEDVSSSLDISGVVLALGSEEGCCAVLHWLGSGTDAIVEPPAVQLNQKKLDADAEFANCKFEQIPVVSSSQIVPRISEITVDVQHDNPALVNEYYAINIVIVNTEVSEIRNVSISVQQAEEIPESAKQISTEFFEDLNKVPCSKLSDINLGDLYPHAKFAKTIYCRCAEAGRRQFLLEVSYNIDIEQNCRKLGCRCINSTKIDVAVHEPFGVDFSIMNMKFAEAEKVYSDVNFILVVDIKSQSPWPLVFANSFLDVGAPTVKLISNDESQVADVELNKDECAKECRCFIVQYDAPLAVSLGTYNLTWKRKNSEKAVTTAVSLPVVQAEAIPLSVAVDMPSFGCVNKPLPVKYTLHNRTSHIQDMEAVMEVSDAFMFSGNKQLFFRMLPSGKFSVVYNFYPLCPGYVPLPKLRVNMVQYAGVIDVLLQSMMPEMIFVRPSSHSSSDEQQMAVNSS